MDQIAPKDTKQSPSSLTEGDKKPQIQRKLRIALIIFLQLLLRSIYQIPKTPLQITVILKVLLSPKLTHPTIYCRKSDETDHKSEGK